MSVAVTSSSGIPNAVSSLRQVAMLSICSPRKRKTMDHHQVVGHALLKYNNPIWSWLFNYIVVAQPSRNTMSTTPSKDVTEKWKSAQKRETTRGENQKRAERDKWEIGLTTEGIYIAFSRFSNSAFPFSLCNCQVSKCVVAFWMTCPSSSLSLSISGLK